MTDQIQEDLAEVVRLMYAYESGRGEGEGFDDAAHSFIRTHHAEIARDRARLAAADVLLRGVADSGWFKRNAPATTELIREHLKDSQP